jgi:hypothetical protein
MRNFDENTIADAVLDRTKYDFGLKLAARGARAA